MVHAFIFGALIGLAAGALLLLRGRVAGIGGMFGALVAGSSEHEDRVHQVLFVAGLVAAGLVVRAFSPASLASPGGSYGVVVLAGLLVGFGMQRGAGCTSGHGVCGIARLSKRSLVATLTFMATGIATVLLTHHILGGSR